MPAKVHVDDELPIARNAYRLYCAANPDAPPWSALSAAQRVAWRDDVQPYAATITQPSFSLKEACLKQAIREWPPRPQFNPDAIIAQVAKEKS